MIKVKINYNEKSRAEGFFVAKLKKIK